MTNKRKLSAETSGLQAHDNKKKSNKEPGGKESDAALPLYGTQGYWDDRYQAVSSAPTDENKEMEQPGPDAFHSWYFTYQELEPILMPLIVGEEWEQNEEPDEKESGEPSACDQEGDDNPEENETENEDGPEVGDDDGNNNIDEEGLEGEESDEDEYEEVTNDEDEEDEDGDDEPPPRLGFINDSQIQGPIHVLEVGCGDVPLGTELTSAIHAWGEQHQKSSILDRVICLDYSKVLIEQLKASKEKQVDAVEYHCEDARKLPYDKNQFSLILEKGTMDAMLSDVEEGKDNCRAIVAEMARVLTVGGAIVIISHLNAQNSDGLEWLDTLVVPGLRKGAGEYNWMVEVHGNDAASASAANNSDDAAPDLGPAVYVIHKLPASEEEKSKDDYLPTIPIRFFSY
eukprot:Nitzschia sp. Nitz4//scaffold170_size48074//30367//31646//NITZ4_007108-RA/size48074-augustus-gene-0.34-mRNA-1//-1//CDS//3329538649//1903//frame0